jgi:hypothetical protein
MAHLSVDYRQRHYLIGLVFADLLAVLDTNVDSECARTHAEYTAGLHTTAIGTVYSLLLAHEQDPRLIDTSTLQQCALLYFPLVGAAFAAATTMMCHPGTDATTQTRGARVHTR